MLKLNEGPNGPSPKQGTVPCLVGKGHSALFFFLSEEAVASASFVPKDNFSYFL
jgi:hypothetical protein